eukprot:scaffold12578_cov30-Tisochrysis_lutea.AAC.4
MLACEDEDLLVVSLREPCQQQHTRANIATKVAATAPGYAVAQNASACGSPSQKPQEPSAILRMDCGTAG